MFVVAQGRLKGPVLNQLNGYKPLAMDFLPAAQVVSEVGQSAQPVPAILIRSTEPFSFFRDPFETRHEREALKDTADILLPNGQRDGNEVVGYLGNAFVLTGSIEGILGRLDKGGLFGKAAREAGTVRYWPEFAQHWKPERENGLEQPYPVAIRVDRLENMARPAALAA